MSERTAISVPTWLAQMIVKTTLTGILGLQIYLVSEIHALREEFTGLSTRVDALAGNTAKHIAQK